MATRVAESSGLYTAPRHADELDSDITVVPAPSGAADWQVRVLFSPAAGEVLLELVVPEAEFVTLRVFDAAGRLVDGVHAGDLDPGVHAFRWDGREAARRSGVFFLQTVAPSFRAQQKFILLN